MMRHLVAVALGMALWPFLCAAYVFGAVFYTIPLAIRHAARLVKDDALERKASIAVYGQMTCPARRVVSFR